MIDFFVKLQENVCATVLANINGRRKALTISQGKWFQVHAFHLLYVFAIVPKTKIQIIKFILNYILFVPRSAVRDGPLEI